MKTLATTVFDHFADDAERFRDLSHAAYDELAEVAGPTAELKSFEYFATDTLAREHIYRAYAFGGGVTPTAVFIAVIRTPA